MFETSKNLDKTEIFHDALIQHGPLSNRIYLMNLKEAEPSRLTAAMDELAENKGYTKIFAKIPASQASSFIESGYHKEAEVPGFYNGSQAALFLGKFLKSERKKEESPDTMQKTLDLAQAKSVRYTEPAALPDEWVIRKCLPKDAEVMSGIYKEVFLSYPFPIDKPEFILYSMEQNLLYFGIEVDGKLVSLASAEMNLESGYAEMTDFATLQTFRGNGFASILLGCMENEMRNNGIKTAYTIARAVSPAMNITFSKAGYIFGGRLVNNTNIAGKIESMNIWYKKL